MYERIFKTINAFLTNNYDVLTEDEIKDLREQLEFVTFMIKRNGGDR
jgi:hypothetical protein